MGPFGLLCGSWSRLDPDNLIRWTPLAPQVGVQNRTKIDPRSVPNATILVNIFGIDFRALLGSILVRFGAQSGAQIGPKSISRAIRKQMQTSLKTICFYNENGSPGGSKIDQKSMKNGSENDHNLSCQNNTQKVVNMAPKLVQNGAQVGSKID